MGGGGGSSSSSSTSSTTTNVDKRMVVDNGVGVSSDQSTVTVTDLGAIDKAFSFAGASGDKIITSFDKVVGLADVLLKGSLDAVKTTNGVVSQAYETAKNSQTGAIDQKTMIVLAVAGAVAFVASRKK